MIKALSEYVWKFSVRNDLVSKDSRLLISASGGVDSQLLIKVFEYLYINNYLTHEPKIIHFNHQVRSVKEHQTDYHNIKELTNFEIMKRDIFVRGKTNLEYNLRLERKKEYKKYADYIILQAHHLNDSFEWYLMQSFKTAGRKTAIPIKNRNIRRPFMCLSKKQIINFAKLLKINYQKDQTNQDINFERNYIRRKIVPLIEKRYPSYLKNHVLRMKSEFCQSAKVIKKKYYHLHVDFSFKEIESSIFHFSKSHRGNLREQLLKLEKNFSRELSSGPMLFSGGVKAYVFPSFILVTDLDFRDVFLKARKINQPTSIGESLEERLVLVKNVQKFMTGKVGFFKYSRELKLFDLNKLLISLGKTDSKKLRNVDFFSPEVNFSSHI